MGISSKDPCHNDFNDSSHGPLQQEELSEKLKGYYLVRSYAPDAEPYAVISDLSEEDGQSIAIKNDPIRGSDNYKQRLKTEEWLRQNAESAGIKLDKATPAYFAFTNDPDFIAKVTEQRAPHKNLIVLPADQIDLSNWSFTMDDHFFANFDEGVTSPSHAEPHPLHGRVLNANELVQALETHGYPGDPYKNNFEAQMWAREPSILHSVTKQKLETDTNKDSRASFDPSPA